MSSEISLVGDQEPCVFALALKRNDLSKQSEFYAVPLKNLVLEFDNFFKDSVEKLKQFKLPHLSNPTP